MLLPFAALAELRQHGNIIFELPDGWQTDATQIRGTDNAGSAIATTPPDRTDGGKVRLLTPLPPADTCASCVIAIGAGGPRDLPIEEFVTANQSQFVEPDDVGGLQPMGRPIFFTLNGRETVLIAQTSAGKLHVTAIITLSDRYEVLGFEGPAATRLDMAQSMGLFEGKFTALLRGLKFASEGTASLLPAAVPGDLDGLWWGLASAWAIGDGGMMRMQITHRHLTFWPDGHFYDGTPPQGLRAPDRSALLAASDMTFGVYRREGDRVHLTYADGARQILTLSGGGNTGRTMMDATMTAGDVTYRKVTPLEDGSRISGTLTSGAGTVAMRNLIGPGAGTAGGVQQGTNPDANPAAADTGALLAAGPEPLTAGGAGPDAASDMSFRLRGGVIGATAEDTAGLPTVFNRDGTYDDDRTGPGAGAEVAGAYAVRDGLIISFPANGAPPRAELIFRAGQDIVVGEHALAD